MFELSILHSLDLEKKRADKVSSLSLYEEHFYMILQSSRCPKAHSNSWLSDLKVGKATEILQEGENMCYWGDNYRRVQIVCRDYRFNFI